MEEMLTFTWIELAMIPASDQARKIIEDCPDGDLSFHVTGSRYVHIHDEGSNGPADPSFPQDCFMAIIGSIQRAKCAEAHEGGGKLVLRITSDSSSDTRIRRALKQLGFLRFIDFHCTAGDES